MHVSERNSVREEKLDGLKNGEMKAYAGITSSKEGQFSMRSMHRVACLKANEFGQSLTLNVHSHLLG